MEKKNKNIEGNDSISVADQIWEEIKSKKIDMFSLPDQVVSQYCKPAVVEPSKCYLLASASSLLPSLETALGKNYNVELVTKYIVVSKKG